MRPSIHRSRKTARPERRAAGRPRLRAAREDGFTLFEVLIAAVVLVIGLLGTFSLLDASVKTTANTRAHEGATGLVREILEDTRTLAYSTVGPNSTTPLLQAMHGLENTSGGATWIITRRGTTYTVVVKECAIDDPKDGYGKHENAITKENPFCKDAGEGEGTADSAPEDLKRVTAEVSWKATGRKPLVKEVETLTAAGQSPGLSASELKLKEPKTFSGTATAPVITSNTAALTFSVISPTGTAAMEWSLDGVRQSPQPKFVSGNEWSFSWSIPLPEVSDGAYKVTVQAIDETGVYGPPISITVTLIRTVPAAPKVKYGGFNEVFVSGVKKKIVELQWEPDTERNVIGYRTYEPAPGAALACPESLSTLSLESSCADLLASAPEPSSSALTYSVVALYRKAEGEALSSFVSEGPAGTFTLSKTILTPNVIPEKPGLSGEKTEEGVKLTWTAPVGGQTVAFYRVYRGSQNITGRYAVVPASKTEFFDAKSTEPHKYWVTAVSETMTESAFCCNSGLEI